MHHLLFEVLVVEPMLLPFHEAWELRSVADLVARNAIRQLHTDLLAAQHMEPEETVKAIEIAEALLAERESVSRNGLSFSDSVTLSALLMKVLSFDRQDSAGNATLRYWLQSFDKGPVNIHGKNQYATPN
jgi:hypothetical protein